MKTNELLLDKLYEVRKARHKELIRGHEKRTVDGSKIQQVSYLFDKTIPHGRDDVK
jgi:hypothetical protein